MTTYSDLSIPTRAAIVDRACDLLGSAYRLQDDPTARQLERLIANIEAAGLCWQLGALYVASPSGASYRVTRAGCDCPNARAGKRQCWHVAAYELLLDMLQTQADTMDMYNDPPDEPCPLGDSEGDTTPRALWARVTTMRGAVCAAW